MEEIGNNYFNSLFSNATGNYTKISNVLKFSQGVQVPIENQEVVKKDGFNRFIRIVDITQNDPKDIRYIEATQKGYVQERDIFMIRYGTPGIMGRNYEGNIANNLFKINTCSDDVTINYVYRYFKSKAFQDYIKKNATSSTMPAINFSLLNNKDILIPNEDDLIKFDKVEEVIRIKQKEIINQNSILINVRDALLPKLMNGEIDLDNVTI